MFDLKTKSIGFYTSIVTFVLGIISLILFAVVASDGEGISNAVYPSLIIGLLLIVGTVILSQLEATKKYFKYGSAIASGLFMLALVMYFIGRITWFMNLASKNNVTPMYPLFIVAAIFLGITAVVSIVNCFLKIEK